MELFDFSLFVGSRPKCAGEATLADVRGYLDRVDGAGVVTSLAGAYYDWEAGNRETLELASEDSRLVAGLTVDPRQVNAGHFDVAAQAAKGFGALVLFPDVQGWALSHPWAVKAARGASAAGLPIVVQAGRQVTGAGIGAIAQVAKGCGVSVVACGLSYYVAGDIIATAVEAENLLFGIKTFAGLDNVETLAVKLGPQRLVYESGEGLDRHEPVLEVLKKAVVSEEARSLIAAGNARRIFGEVG